MHLHYCSVVLTVALSLSATGLAGDGLGIIRCEIGGATNVFGGTPKAVGTAAGGLELIATARSPGGLAALSISLPHARLGVQALTSDPKVTLHYSRNAWSSASEDHFDARRDSPGTSVTVNLSRTGGLGEWIEGTFSGVVSNGAGHHLVVTNGSFRLVRTAAEEPGPPKAPGFQSSPIVGGGM